MALVSEQKLEIIQTERGSSIAETRITLYDVMDYLKVNRSPHHIASKLGLTTEQINFAIAYILVHQEQLETEYQACLTNQTEVHRYWDEYNRDRFAKIAALSPNSKQAALREKLTDWNDRINAST